MTEDTHARIHRLTDEDLRRRRELELKLKDYGLTLIDISRRVGVAPKTVKKDIGIVRRMR